MQPTLFDTAESGADISHCGKWRYSLWRIWDRQLPTVTWIMLNPSTAAETPSSDDNTIRRCCAFSRRFGYGGLVVVNLFAFRCRDPKELQRHEQYDQVGPKNASAVNVALQGQDCIAAWGHVHKSHRWRVHQMRQSICGLAQQSYCLGRTKDGQPRHPLMLRADQQREVWP